MFKPMKPETVARRAAERAAASVASREDLRARLKGEGGERRPRQSVRRTARRVRGAGRAVM